MTSEAMTAFEHALLDSERLRLRLLFWFAVAFFLMTSFAVTVRWEVISQSAMHLPPRWLPPALGFVAVGGTFLARRSLDHVRGGLPPAWMSYFTAFMEITTVAVGGWFVGNFVGAAQISASPMAEVFALMIVLFALRMDPWLPLFAGAVAALEFSTVTWLLSLETPATEYDLGRARLRGFLFFLVGGATAFVTAEIRRRLDASLAATDERNRVVGLFGRHVSPKVVDALLAQRSQMSTETRHVCILFLDIRSFTTLCEGLSPNEVVELLNTLFAFMIDEVNDHDGFINKFLGDGFMAVFGAPMSDGRDSENAVACALSILARLQQLQTDGVVPAELRIGMGLHAGEALTGNIGSPTRKEYTVIGDVVNVASRIEGLNKRFGSQVLVSGEVWGALDGVDGTELGAVEVKGRVAPVPIHQLA
jgi:adenylate cyclase